mmetsp:Transcript_5407/g.14513  ORF Transcript_5407/g.14513 Transcript_5407/m.14513 type:complete len:216 (-) Transcript_5407:705-1352(-)
MRPPAPAMSSLSSAGANTLSHAGAIRLRNPRTNASACVRTCWWSKWCAIRWTYRVRLADVTRTSEPPGMSSLSPPVAASVAVKCRKRSSTWSGGRRLSESRWWYSSGSKVARSLSSGGRPSRSLARKKPARGRSTSIPSYTALPNMAPRNSSFRRWSTPHLRTDAGFGYKVLSGVSANRPVSTGSKACAMRSFRKSLNKPPPSTPASSTPCSFVN